MPDNTQPNTHGLTPGNPPSKPAKPEPTLELSDLVAQVSPAPVDSIYPQADVPTIEQPADAQTPSSLEEAPLPEPEIVQPQITTSQELPEASDVTVETTAPAEENPQTPNRTENTIPLFHNPQAPAMTSHLEEFGKAPQLAYAGTPPSVRPNLKPHFDVFALYGLSSDNSTQYATTFFGKLALALHLDKIMSPRNKRYIGVSLFSFIVFLLVFNFQTLSVQLGYFLNPPQPTAPVTTTTPTPSTTPASLAEAAEIVPAGDVISIPKIKVDKVPIIFEQSISEAAIQKALESGVVHYAGTALPGERSNIVIVGHSSNDWWEPGNYKFIFALLEKLTPGDQIQVNYQTRKYVFEVTGSKVVEPTEISVLQPTSEPQLTLITCTPPGTSWKRLIVTAKQVAPLPNAVKQTVAENQTQAQPQVSLPGNAPSLIDQIKSWFGLNKA